MARLKQGDVLEVLLDNNQNKGYIVYLGRLYNQLEQKIK